MEKDVIRSTHSCPCCVEEKLSKDLAGLIQQGEEDDHESPIDRVLVECGWASPRTLRNRLQEAKERRGRERLFVTSKVWNDDHRPSDVIAACIASLDRLQVRRQ